MNYSFTFFYEKTNDYCFGLDYDYGYGNTGHGCDT